jgi:transcriptional regulator with XRE-family HTH domain
MTKTNKSEVEIAESTVEGRIEMAAAEASFDAVGLLTKVVRASGLSQREIADALGVGESRVSQVLSGDGNLRITTLARYLRAAGYALRLEAIPADPGVSELPKPRSRRLREADTMRAMTADFIKCWESPVLSTLGVGTAYTFHADLGSGHEIVIGERASIDPREVPSEITDWVMRKTFTPIARQLPVSWRAVSITEEKLDREYVDH